MRVMTFEMSAYICGGSKVTTCNNYSNTEETGEPGDKVLLYLQVVYIG